MIDCQRADFIDGTRRVMGTITDREHDLVLDHALKCERTDWWHALSPEAMTRVAQYRTRTQSG